MGLRFAEPGSLGENLRLGLCPLNLLILPTVHTQYLVTPPLPRKESHCGGTWIIGGQEVAEHTTDSWGLPWLC